jgi:hypothetical protein
MRPVVVFTTRGLLPDAPAVIPYCRALTEECIADVTPVIPLDKCFWTISSKESKAIQ